MKAHAYTIRIHLGICATQTFGSIIASLAALHFRLGLWGANSYRDGVSHLPAHPGREASQPRGSQGRFVLDGVFLSCVSRRC